MTMAVLWRGNTKQQRHELDVLSCLVYLECDIKENIRRITSPQRKNSGTTKLLDPDVLADMRSGCQLFRFDGVEDITCDVTSTGQEETAKALKREIIAK